MPFDPVQLAVELKAALRTKMAAAMAAHPGSHDAAMGAVAEAIAVTVLAHVQVEVDGKLSKHGDALLGPLVIGGDFDALVPEVAGKGGVGSLEKPLRLVRAEQIVSGDLHLRDDRRNAHWTLREFADSIEATNQTTGRVYRLAMVEKEEKEECP